MPTRLLLCAVCGAVLWASSPAISAATDVDVAALAAALDSDFFRSRQRAQQALLEAGTALVGELLEGVQPAANASDAEVDAYFTELERDAYDTLQQQFYNHLDRQQSLEARFRGARIRAAMERTLQAGFGALRAKYPVPLPAENAKKVYGSGGFREGTSWFDAKFQNSTAYTVTSIHILVRVTHQETGETTERLAVLGTEQGPMSPGESAKWSADVKMKRGPNQNFYWEKRKVFGFPLPVTAD